MAGNLGGLVKRLQDIMRQDAGINGDAQRIEQIVWMLFLKVYTCLLQKALWLLVFPYQQGLRMTLCHTHACV